MNSTSQNVFLENFFKDEVNVTILLLLSQFTGFIFAPLGILSPFFIWLNFKDKSELVSFYAKEILNFQINIFLLTLPLFLLYFVNPFLITLMVIPVILNIFFMFMSVTKAKKKQKFHFPYTLKLIKGAF